MSDVALSPDDPSEPNDLAKILRRYGITRGEALTVDQMKAMTLALKAGELKLEHFKQIAGITKSFNSVAVEAAKSFTASVESAGNVKKEAIIALKEITRSLEKIATSTDSDHIKDKVIDCLMRIADKLEKADERNHGFFIGAILIAASVVVSVIARRPVRIA